MWVQFLACPLTYRTFSHGGRGTNTKVEAMALWGLLWFSYFLDIPSIHIHGDSKIIIDQLMAMQTSPTHYYRACSEELSYYGINLGTTLSSILARKRIWMQMNYQRRA